jgi:hypothetical protein
MSPNRKFSKREELNDLQASLNHRKGLKRESLSSIKRKFVRVKMSNVLKRIAHSPQGIVGLPNVLEYILVFNKLAVRQSLSIAYRISKSEKEKIVLL